MRKLYRKTKTVDTLLDEKGDRSTLRIGWSEVIENLDRGSFSSFSYFMQLTSILFSEAQARHAWLSTLSTDVIAPLTNLKARINGFRYDAI